VQSREIFIKSQYEILKLSIQCTERLITIGVHVAAVEALRQKERQDETQSTTKFEERQDETQPTTKFEGIFLQFHPR
jgi:hypothetical protein